MIHSYRLGILCFLVFSAQIQGAFAGLKVAVIGAGLSGLTTAYRLQASSYFRDGGYEVDVYEARARVGGRVFTVKINGSPEELGGQNLNDGGEALHIKKLAKELGLSIQETELKSRPYYYDLKARKLYDFNRDLANDVPPLNDSRKELLHRLEGESKNMNEVMQRYFGANSVLKDAFYSRLKSYESSEPENLSTSYTSGSFLWMLENAEQAAAIEKQNKLSTYKNSSIQGGNASLTEAMERKLGQRVHLKMALNRIKKLKSGYELEFASGQTYYADFVIISVPAAVLKKIHFENNAVPDERLKDLISVPMGPIAKVLVPIEKNKDIFGYLNTERLVSWFNPSGKVMTLYYSGKAVSEVGSPDFATQLNSDLEPIRECFPSLGGLSQTQGVMSQTLTHPQEEQFSTYSSPLEMNWAREPFSMGGYSYFSPKMEPVLKKQTEAYGEKVIELFRPIDGQLFFAGEHTALENPATMEGAVESGERTSRMVLRALGYSGTTQVREPNEEKNALQFSEKQQQFFVKNRKHYSYFYHLSSENMSPQAIQSRFALGSDENEKYLKDLERIGLVQVKKDHTVSVVGAGKVHQWKSTDPLGKVQYYPVIRELVKEVEKNDQQKKADPTVFSFSNGFILSPSEIMEFKKEFEKLQQNYSDLSVKNRDKLNTGLVKKVSSALVFGHRHDQKVFPEVDNEL